MVRDSASGGRILVALEDTGQLRVALEEAAVLAVRTRSELAALFIEDLNLINLSGLPFAREVLRSTASQRQLDPMMLARQMRLRVERLRSTLEGIAAEQKLHTTLNVVRGKLVADTLLASGPADVIFLMGRRLGGEFALRSNLPAARRRPVCVYWNATEAAGRALRVAARLVGDGPGEAIVLARQVSSKQQAELADRMRGDLRNVGREPRLVCLATDAHGDILVAARALGSRLLVLPVELPAGATQAIQTLASTDLRIALVA